LALQRFKDFFEIEAADCDPNDGFGALFRRCADPRQHQSFWRAFLFGTQPWRAGAAPQLRLQSYGKAVQRCPLSFRHVNVLGSWNSYGSVKEVQELVLHEHY
jgi:hypothetical protein